MKEKIISAAKICANCDMSDIEWHLACAKILQLGLTSKSLEDYYNEQPAKLGEITQGNIHVAASFINNFLNAFNKDARSYMKEAQFFIQQFNQYIDSH